MVKIVRVRIIWVFLLVAFLSGCRVQKYPPELTQALPSRAPIGQEVTLTGFQFGDEPTVTFGKDGEFYTARVSEATDQTIKVIVPRMPINNAQVRVANEQGTSDPVSFSVLQPIPIVTSVTPANALPGQSVVITGDYLDQLQWVRFGPGAINISAIPSASQQTVTVTIPQVPRGPQLLEVETTGGKTQRPFLIAGNPEISGFSPKRPRLSEEVTVQGKNLLDGVIRVNGLAMALTRNTDNELRFNLPANATSGKISVTLYDQLTATTADSLLIAFVPVIDQNGFSITEGIAGDRLIVNGRNLRDVTAVTVGNVSTTFRALSDTQLEITLPERSQTGEVFITLTSLGGSITSTQALLYYNAPANLTFTPTRTLRGREVVINGQSVYRITGVAVNGRPAQITGRIEGSEVRATVPADATTGPIVVTNRAGSATSRTNLTVVLPPTVTDITRKAIVGERVVLTGSFLLDARVFFTGSAGQAAYDGRNTDGELWVRVPNDARNGPVRVVNDAGETTTTVSFTALRAPFGIAISPDLAKVGAEITLSGQNLTDVTEVRFGNGKSAPARFRVSGQNLIVTVPADATSGPICLTNEAGTTCSSGTFNVLAAPGNITFTPTSSTVGGTVTISGTNLSNASEVRFNNGRSSAALFRLSGQSLIVTVPNDAQDGPICVTNAGGTTCSSTNFNALLPPASLALSVTSAAVGAEITITGSSLATAKEVRFGNGRSSAARFRTTTTTPVGLIVTVPADAQNGPICVTNDGGTTCTAVSFTVR